MIRFIIITNLHIDNIVFQTSQHHSFNSNLISLTLSGSLLTFISQSSIGSVDFSPNVYFNAYGYEFFRSIYSEHTTRRDGISLAVDHWNFLQIEFFGFQIHCSRWSKLFEVRIRSKLGLLCWVYIGDYREDNPCFIISLIA